MSILVPLVFISRFVDQMTKYINRQLMRECFLERRWTAKRARESSSILNNLPRAKRRRCCRIAHIQFMHEHMPTTINGTAAIRCIQMEVKEGFPFPSLIVSLLSHTHDQTETDSMITTIISQKFFFHSHCLPLRYDRLPSGLDRNGPQEIHPNGNRKKVMRKK